MTSVLPLNLVLWGQSRGPCSLTSVPRNLSIFLLPQPCRFCLLPMRGEQWLLATAPIRIAWSRPAPRGPGGAQLPTVQLSLVQDTPTTVSLASGMALLCPRSQLLSVTNPSLSTCGQAGLKAREGLVEARAGAALGRCPRAHHPGHQHGRLGIRPRAGADG